MASFKDFVRLKTAFNCYDKYGICNCSECPLSHNKNGKGENCEAFVCNNPEKAEAIIDKWCSEHPAKTRKYELLKMFPKARLDKNGIPIFCPNNLTQNECPGKDCDECRKKFWMEEIE